MEEQQKYVSDSETETGRVKTCTHCKVQKPVTEFYKNKTTPDGYEYWCKACKKVLDRDRRARRSEISNLKSQISKAAATAPAVADPDHRSDGALSPSPEALLFSPVIGERLTPRECLAIDFADYPEILEKIKHVAKEQIRTPEAQAIWYLRDMMKTRR